MEKGLRLHLASSKNSVDISGHGRHDAHHHGTCLSPFSPNVPFLCHHSGVFHIRKEGGGQWWCFELCAFLRNNFLFSEES